MAGRGHEILTLAYLQGHEKAITGIALPERSSKLYTASKDGTVRVWDCNTGQCIRVINLAGEAGALISKGPWVFCGAPNVVKAWNIETNAEFSLDGPVGQVHAMECDKEMLFAGTDSGVILVWKEKGPFQLASSLNGHTAAVVCLRIGSAATKLYSGSVDHTIRVWDLETLQCVATLNGHSDVVTSVIGWDQFLISCSLDCRIKVWHMTEKGNFNLEVIYTHNVEHGIVALLGMHDAEGKPVLVCSSSDHSIRLCDLPSFTERARLSGKQEVRAIQVGVGGLFFGGDAILVEHRPRTPLSPTSDTYQTLVPETDGRNQVPLPQPAMTPESCPKAPRSPRLAAYQKPGLKTDRRTQIPVLWIPSTPEPSRRAPDEVQIVMESKVTLSTGNQQPMMETHSTTKCAGSLNDEKSLITNSARTLRRQSLTGIPTSGSDRSRRSSLGGKPVDTSVNDNRNAKTPPPVCSSTKNNKRWLYFPWSFCFDSKHTDQLKLGYTPTISRRRLSDRLWHSYNA